MAQLRLGAIYEGLVHMNSDGESADIFVGILWRGIIDQAFSGQGQHQFPGGQALEPAAELNPVPMSAKFPGNVGPALVPVFVNHCLDNGQVFGGNFAVSVD
jgi:hypothetical protein